MKDRVVLHIRCIEVKQEGAICRLVHQSLYAVRRSPSAKDVYERVFFHPPEIGGRQARSQDRL
jgi:hypothetical protein